MDHLGQFSSPLLGSFSLPSLAEGSEAISEAEEINEVKSLHDQGVRAAKTADFNEAIQFYNEALEIDCNDARVLQARALVFLQQGKTSEASQDAESILAIDPNNAQGHLLQGLSLQQSKHYKQALASMLTALELDTNLANKVTNHISKVVANFCQISDELVDNLKDMDPYAKLSELGVMLFQNRRYEECISVLETSRKFQTNQKGITMRILLTQANAHSQLLQTEAAIELYQECLGLAVATHEQIYQTKALVNMATLHLERGETHQAIIFYEKLLHLGIELRLQSGSGKGDTDDHKSELKEEGDMQDSERSKEEVPDGRMPEYWTKELQCGLHLNLSIAYKTIGNMAVAARHAEKYMSLARKFDLDPKLQAESHHNTGMLNEILGHYEEALECYQEYLAISKKNGNKKGIGQAYGCLASVYAALRNWPLALTFHGQQLALASHSRDRRMTALAHEMMGDTLSLKGDYETAIEHYNQMLLLCRSRDNRGDATSRCKMAAAYKAMGQLQYSLYYYTEALSLAQRFGLSDLETMAQFHVACINKDSTQFAEREDAQSAFLRLIPFFEKKIQKHVEESSHCPEEYETQLVQCYDGMQTVLARSSNKLGCLQYAEAHRKRSVVALPNFQATCRASNHSLDSSREIWGTDHMHRIVSEQSATVLYYSLMDQLLLLWVLQPAVGVARFYTTNTTKDNTFPNQVISLLNEIGDGMNKSELFSSSEPRALPLKDADVQHTRAQNLRLTSAKTIKPGPNARGVEKKKPALRHLFDLLIAPVSDLLDQLEDGSHLVIVPDKQLKACPFGALLDYSGLPLGDRFHISTVPCLLLLDRVVQNELSSLSLQGELEFQRRQTRKGGIRCKFGDDQSRGKKSSLTLHGLTRSGPKTESAKCQPKPLNMREVSNPRLASSQGLHNSASLSDGSNMAKKTSRSRESTFLSVGGRSGKGFSITTVPEDKMSIAAPEQNLNKPSTRSLGLPTSLDKMLSVHTLSTLTTRTSTGTDITSSTQVVPEFRQVSDPRASLVFGCPNIPHSVLVHEKLWAPKADIEKAQQELCTIARCLGTHAVMGNACTKREVVAKLGTAHIVHIATWACLRDGVMLMTPDPLTTGQIDDHSHLLTISDILNMKLQAKVVVLSSSGLSASRTLQESPISLASSFLSAGCESVLVCLWPIPDDALCKFLFHFYMALQEGSWITSALREGVKSLREDERWNYPYYWAPFSLIGKDTQVCVREIKHAQLDQLLDKVEYQQEEESDTPILNPKAPVPNVASKEENLATLQGHLKELLRQHYNNPLVLPGLIDLLDLSLKRLHTAEINKRPVRLADVVAKSGCGLAMLKWLGFHFQAKGEQLSCPYIIFPHWNSDELLIPAYDSLKAAAEMVSNPGCVSSLIEALPLTQDSISCLIDLMSITKHAPEIQLKVTDLSVHPLWHHTKTQDLLKTTGFHQVGLLLTFNMTSTYRQLLTSMLQLLLSVSCHKSPVLLYRLDVSLLGRSSGTASKTSETEVPRLTSLTPLILPKNQLRMSTPWLSVVESHEEMSEKIKLTKSTTNLSEDFADYIERARSWHQTTVVAQANESLEKFGRPASMPRQKVKVRSGATASQRRVPLDEVKQLTAKEVNQRRDYAHFVLHDRLADINKRKKDGVIKLYLPYIKS
ncbi:tetratricopeptide repeat protein 28 [Plakobranchus ocellatus]|uniref:Tetratricopeptide repeat protein 28 n=1 Tax=Plakobranchus ocellatus TaxID=259542 RepID=A0AAV3ZK17_9GAST|nr:tetratricopeptide repeat protein 28 [Plakobranchus ocellatus]